ncbi:uncharacterized protein LOC126840847 isoform X1 [Adelges cooleyi]|uniref:uncharacterized protein LOC126840847 isoform X1 n=1 Tax=Adelges cooleyi TaxID=133065 RepID=UPI00217F87A3|nr:uncharacterized protein LOC126840847 isoform X1 [Adelges cooleyi]XP_050432772.1 uncharacterized protein LOC126840847 isoform X1 [Adelges cooleyi]XP_050432773.1 uncharacterized protein LOC126840847 isoform X1 [Adelges cooleyi]
MTNNKLQVFCLIVLTICTVINEIKCITKKEECRRQISLNNHLISRLNIQQKYNLIVMVVNNFEYEGVGKFLNPPDNDYLCHDVDENGEVYITTYAEEQSFEEELLKILNIQRPDDFTSRGTYDTAVRNRRHILNLAYLSIINEKLKDQRMCENHERIKCMLIGLISHKKYQSKNKQGCIGDNICVITTTELSKQWYSDMHDVTQKMEKYRDHYDSNDKRFKIFFKDPVRGYIEWDSGIPEEVTEDEGSSSRR